MALTRSWATAIMNRPFLLLPASNRPPAATNPHPSVSFRERRATHVKGRERAGTLGAEEHSDPPLLQGVPDGDHAVERAHEMVGLVGSDARDVSRDDVHDPVGAVLVFPRDVRVDN